MRRLRRRRPAGEPQVPIVVVEPTVPAPVVAPAVIRIGPDRTLLDPPWGMFGCTVANVWRDERAAGGWVRVEWPCDGWSGRQIAPLDLHLGHVLEIVFHEDDRRLALYAIAADVAQHQLTLVPAASAPQAALIASRAIDTWKAAELRAAADVWLDRHARELRHPGGE